ncbi:MAG TPA: hypothetical protein DGG95_08315 [Cytophagales bacterium]|jgi:hypothetical protein|nr:hypothetical protein [Cytophagales bacterium]
MNRVNEKLESTIDFNLNDQFPQVLIIKRDLIRGGLTPVISWCIAPTPMVNIQIALSKYKNHLDIKKFICENDDIKVSTIYSGPVPIKTVGPNDHVFDEDFIMKLVAHYKFVAL